MILPLSGFSRQGGSANILFAPKITILKNWILTSGHPRSRLRIDLNRSCCIVFYASWRDEHFGTYLMPLSHSNQKLCLKRNVYWPYDVLIWLGPDTSSATICKKKSRFSRDRKNAANRMVYVIKEHSCIEFVVFLHVWFGVTKSMVSLVPGLCSTHESWVKFDSTLTQMSRVRVESAMKIKDMSRAWVESGWSSFESELSQLDTAWVKIESLIFPKRNLKILHLFIALQGKSQPTATFDGTPPPPPSRERPLYQIRENVMSRESDLTQIWLKWVESELSGWPIWDLSWVGVESIKKSKVLSWVRVESAELSRESESSQPEKSESSTTLIGPVPFAGWLPNLYWCIACFCEWNQ